MSTTSNFQLSLILSAVNRTGAVFNAVQRQGDKLHERSLKFQQHQNDLLSIGTGVSVGMAGYILKSGMELDNIKTRFEIFLKDGNKAKQMLKELNEFANITPFSNQETYQAATALLPYIKDSQEIRKQLTMIGDISSGLKIPFAELARIYGKLKGGDMIQGEELDQLRDRGFAMKYLAQALGTTEDKIKGLGRDGAIHFKHLEKAFKLATQEGGDFYQMTERMSQRAGGKLSTALGTGEYALANSAEKLMPTMVKLLDDIIPIIEATSQWIEKNPELTKTIMEVAMGLTGLSIGTKVLSVVSSGVLLNISKFGVMVTTIQNVRKAYVALRAAQAAGDMVQWYRTLEQYGSAGVTASRALGMATASQLGFNAAALMNPYVLATAGIVALGTAIYYANEKMTELSETEQMRLDSMGAATKQIAKEHSEFTKLWKELEKTNPRSKEFTKIKTELLAQYPQYLNKVDMEKAKIGDLPALYEKASEAMLLYAAQKAVIERGQKAQADWSQAYLEEKVARETYKKTGGNIGDWMRNNFGTTPIGMMGNSFSKSAEIWDAKQKQQAAKNEMKASEDLAKAIAEEIKKAPIRIEVNNKVDKDGITTMVNKKNESNNRGSLKK